MPDHVTFRGATIRYTDFRRKEGGSYVRIHVTSEFTQPVMEAMGWEDPGRSLGEGKLLGELAGTHMVMTPNEKKLRQHEISLDVNRVNAFKLVSVTKDEVTKRELRFVITSPIDGAVALVEQYVRHVSTFEGALKVSYSKQETMDLGDDAKASAQGVGCTSCENEIDFTDDKQKKHVNGLKCTRKVTQINLPAGDAASVM